MVSDLPHFKESMDFLAPGGEISSYWDHLDAPVTTRYWDMAGEVYGSQWRINPFVYESRRYVRRRGIGDLAKSVEDISADTNKISEGVDRLTSRPEPSGTKDGRLDS